MRTNLTWTRSRVAGVVIVALGVAAWLWFAQAAWTLKYWQNQLATVSDEEAPAFVKRLAALGHDGIALLAAGLATPREAVRRESRLALDDQLNLWARLPRDRASAKLAVLAAALAEHAAKYDGESRQFAEDTVTRILLWPTDGNVVDRAQLVADCESTLRAPGTHSGSPERRWTRGSDAVRSELAAADLEVTDVPVITGNKPAWEALQPPELPPLAVAAYESEMPRADAPGQPRKLSTAHLAARHISTVRSGGHETANQAAYFSEDAEQASDADETENHNDDSFQKREALELFALLSRDGDVAARAEKELTRRGFNRTEIEAGMHLTSDNADERRRWTEALPGMRGIDAKNWLLWLSRDRDPAVRRAAVTLMATSLDPEMLRRVEEVSRADADPEVRAQAARISEAANEKLSPYSAR